MGLDELPICIQIIAWFLLFFLASFLEPYVLFRENSSKKNGKIKSIWGRFRFQVVFFMRLLETVAALFLISLFLPLFRLDWLFSGLALASALAGVLVVVRHLAHQLGRMFQNFRLLEILVYPFFLLSFLIFPLAWLARVLGSSLEAFFLREGYRPDLIDSREDLSEFLDYADDQQPLAEQEKEMIRGIVDFRDTQTKEIMVPRIDLVAADIETPVEEIEDLIIESGHSRIPIYEETIDNIIGIIHAKDLLLRIKKQGGKLGDYLRQPYFVPKTKRVNQLLSEFQRDKIQMAIVVDEYGGTAGIVTIEDIMEEIVGEIQDEYDFEEPLVKRLGDGRYLVNAKIDIEELNEALGIDLPSEDFESLGGYILQQLERVPLPGEVIQEDNVSIEIKDADERRVRWAIIATTEEDEKGQGRNKEAGEGK